MLGQLVKGRIGKIALALIFALVVEPVVWLKEAEAVPVTITESYGTTTGITTVNANAGGVVSTRSIQGPKPTITLTNGGWKESISGCIKAANQVQAGKVPGTVQCLNPNPPQACVTVPGGAQACNASLPPSPIQGIDANCLKVSVKVTPKTTNTCLQYAQDPKCVKQSSKCIHKTPQGTCDAWDVTYDCGTNQMVPKPGKSKMVCPGAANCADGSCVSTTPESNNSFGQAASYLQAAAQMQSDGKCNVATGDCTVFPGKDLLCKDYEFFGNTLKNCCAESVPAPDLGSYIDMVIQMNSLDNAIMAINKGSGMFGTWANIHNAVSTQWTSFSNTVSGAFDSITGTLSNAWETIVHTSSKQVASAATKMGAKTATKAVGKSMIAQMQAALTQKVATFVMKNFGTKAVNLLFAPASGSGTASAALASGQQVVLNPAISAALGWIMLAYTIYQITMLLINLIFRCTKPQFEYLMKKKMKVCHVVGMACAHYVCVVSNPFGGGCALGYCARYDEHGCCFDSPLARIIQEQVRPQLGMGWGPVLAPNCSGISLKQLQNVDWSKVDLSEWEAILTSTGHMPTNNTLNVKNVTGAGSHYDVGAQSPTLGTSPDLITRTKDKLTNKNLNQIRNNVQQGIWNTVR